MKKSVRCSQDYRPFVTTSSSLTSTSMSNSGNPPDRGPPSGSAKNLNVLKKVSGIMTSSILSTSPSFQNHATPASSPLNFSSVQVMSRMHNAAQSVLSSSQKLGITSGGNSGLHSSASSSVSTKTPALIKEPQGQTNFLKSNEPGSAATRIKSSDVSYEILSSSTDLQKPTGLGFVSVTNSNNPSTQTQIGIQQSPSLTLINRSSLISQSTSTPTPKLKMVKNELQSTFLPSRTSTNHVEHWESLSSKMSTVLVNTTRQIEKLNNNTNSQESTQEKYSKVSVKSIEKDSSSVPTIKSSNKAMTSNPLKRKSEILLKNNASKKRKVGAGGLLSEQKEKTIFKQWPNLLSSIVERMVMSEEGHKLPLDSLASITSTCKSITPKLPNSLLIQYDPIKILSRHNLHARNQSTNPIIPSCSATLMSLSNAIASTNPLNTLLLNQRTHPVVEQTFTNNPPVSRILVKPPSTSTAKSNYSEAENTIMPPPKFPPPWSNKKKDVGNPSCSSGTSKLISSVSSEQSGIGQSFHRLKILSPPVLPKVDLGVSAKTANKGHELKYDSRQEEVGEIQLRLATIAYARKAVRKSKSRWLLRKRKLSKTSQESSGSTSSSQLIKESANINISTQLNFPERFNNDVSRSAIINDDTDLSAVKSPSSLLSKRQILWKKSPCVLTKMQENPLVENAIDLIRHKRELQKRIELIDEEGIVYRLRTLPIMKERIATSQLVHNNIPLRARQTKEIVQKRLAVLLAHGGFTHVNLQPLNVLSDVMEEFYAKMAHRLKQITEMEMHGVEQEFPDALERTFVEMGLGGVRGVEDFYKTRVVDYRKCLEDQCLQLRQQYASKIKIKVGTVSSSVGGMGSSSTVLSSSSSTTSSQPLSPGNSAIKEILSGLETTTASLHLCEESIPSPRDARPQSPNPPQPYHPQLSTPISTPKTVLPNPSNLLNPLLNVNSPTVSKSQQIPAPVQVQIRNPSSSSTVSTNPQQLKQNLLQANRNVEIQKSNIGGSISHTGSTFNNTLQSNMVSINLNNNVDLGITQSATPLVNLSGGIVMNSASNSKAKLKEALSQKNLLRLNFEQVPSNCDSHSTVLLSSSSPSLSSGTGSKKSSTSSSINQTTQLKL